MTDVFLIAAVRTPIGKFGGTLASLTAAQLGTESAKATIFARLGSMPMVSAATSLPRMADNRCPVVPRRTKMTANAHNANIAIAKRARTSPGHMMSPGAPNTALSCGALLWPGAVSFSALLDSLYSTQNRASSGFDAPQRPHAITEASVIRPVGSTAEGDADEHEHRVDRDPAHREDQPELTRDR